LFSDDAQLLDAEEWLLRLDYSASKPSSIQTRQVERRGQVLRLLKRILPEVSDIRFTQPTGDNPTPSVEFATPFGWVPLRSLGHGYRTLIAWMVDFAGRMVERYSDSPDPLGEPAIVLIDEIDLHLHPSWQRKLIRHLTGLFPNTQFIATAHSPLIVQGAGDANIAVLRREGDHVVIDNDIKAIRGWRVDQILTSDLFDLPTARPAEFDGKLARRKALLSKPKLTKADQRELAKLESEIGILPSGETDEEARRMLNLAEESVAMLKKYGG
jgi:predicted ATP-binding protein involved in virulence